MEGVYLFTSTVRVMGRPIALQSEYQSPYDRQVRAGVRDPVHL